MLSNIDVQTVLIVIASILAEYKFSVVSKVIALYRRFFPIQPTMAEAKAAVIAKRAEAYPLTRIARKEIVKDVP